MRIPLDYYRILSVPVKATDRQLNQAYNDRLLQQPRREYSKAAIDARQELIKYSYQVLSNPEQRAIYDAQFLLNMQPNSAVMESEIEPSEGEDPESTENEGNQTQDDTLAIPAANPTIEIPSSQVVGALLILHELGEYETVLTLGIDLFNCRELEQSDADEVILDQTQEDLILGLALAYMELGREQWHRKEYEHAAISGQMGCDLLHSQSLFPHLQEELEGDLFRLRPYRILGLISQNPPDSTARTQGFQLLQSMLMQRQGIEGRGEDRSGLNFDQFLCFVQQLRTYLTSTEQQQLFDAENQQDSAIANYLAVYTLLGRGFCFKQPELVLRAQRKLNYLAEKQDVSWEQAMAALLLGHTEKAISKLEQAPDPSKLEEVQQHSQGSFDLLPGLCFYGEQWLQQEVIAQFKDLSTIELTLKEYFADPEVQSFLEELSLPTLKESNNIKSIPAVNSTSTITPEEEPAGLMSLWRNIFPTEKPQLLEPSSSSRATASSRELVGAGISRSKSASTATIERNQSQAVAGNSRSSSQRPPNLPRPKSLTLPLQPREERAVPPAVMAKATARNQARRKKRSAATLVQGWLFIFSLIFGVGALGFVVTKLFLSPRPQIATQPQLAIAISNPAVTIPPKKETKETKEIKKTVVAAPKPKVTLTSQSQQVIQTWLQSKSAAFGQEHQIDQLNQILAEPLLTTWRERAKVYQQENLYREYEHKITMRSAKINPQDRNQATVEAEVQEVAKHYQSGQLDQSQSYDDNLLVRYQLVRQQGKWLINQAEVVKTL
ncbi:MAG: IMS domain-containing protein [Cyanobacteria bacterium P01_A01_bin.83]